MKWWYFFEDTQSKAMFPINSEYTLQAVSNPKLISMCSFFKSPSIVFGHPITLFLKKYINKFVKII